MRKPLKLLAFSAVLTATCVAALAMTAQANPIPLTAANEAYTQDFDTLANTGTANALTTLPLGWTFFETGSNANTTYRAVDGGNATGDTCSFGASGSAERAFGGLRSGSLVPTIGASFLNETNETIHTLAIVYTGEQWRLGATGREDLLEFVFSTTATTLNDANGAWASVSGLDFRAPNTTGTLALNGNLDANRRAIRHTLTNLAIAPGQTFWIRWNDIDVTGSDDNLAIDDFSLTPNPTPAAPVDFVKEVKVIGGGAATTGSVVEYDVYFENTADTDIVSLVFADTLPDNFVPIGDGFEADIDGVVVALTADADADIGTIAGQNVTVQVGPLAPGEAVLVTFRARIGTVNTAGSFNATTRATWQAGTAPDFRSFTAFASATFPTIVTGILQFNIFFDSNNNGTRDEGEDGLAGWEVLATGTDIVTTGDDGLAALGRVPVGTIDVLVDAAVADGVWNFTDPETATITANQTTTVAIAVTCTCNDNSVCTQTDRCDKGACFFENPLDCGVNNDPCVVNTCDDTLGCTEIFTTAGCNDGNLSTRNDTCNGAGTCVGSPYICGAGECQVSSTTNGDGCDVVPEDVGTACNDALNTTRNDSCNADGICVGEPYTCTPSDNPCVAVVQNGSGCGFEPINPGGRCNDGLASTRDDICNAEGECAGEIYECPVSTNPCITNITNGTDCTATPTNLGGTCNDNSDATSNDVCTSNGTCAGTPIVCTPSTNPCQANVPNGTTCELRPTNLGGQCNDGLSSTRSDICNANGVCAGEIYECPVSTNPCVTNITNGTDCTATPTNLGGTCNDNSDATSNDVCTSNGTCAGTPIVCTPSQCEETSAPNGIDCTATFKAANTDCDDGRNDTRNDGCDGAGTCGGEAYTCEPTQCEATSVPNGTDCTMTFKVDTESCDDGNICTTNDLCNGSGVCGGAPVTCDIGEVCGNEGTCEATHCETCVDDLGCGDESACVAVGDSAALRCLVACENDEDCTDGQVCAAHPTAGNRCFDAEGECAVVPEEPNPDAVADSVEPGPEAQPETQPEEVAPVEPGPEATPDAPVEGETITSGGGGCSTGNGAAGSSLMLLALMVFLASRRRHRV